MKVELSKVYPMEASTDQAWALLQDIEKVAGCMPGAQVTERVDDNHYKGSLKVSLGPVSATFNGDIEVKEIDAAQRRIRLLGKGADSKGSSSARMDLTACVREAGPRCELVGDSAVTVNGKLANFGGRMMTQVADQILKQFADNFAGQMPASTGESGGPAAKPRSAQGNADQTRGLNVLALAWNAIVGLIKSLFTRTPPG